MKIDDFVVYLGEPAEYEYRKGGFGDGATSERIKVASAKPPAVLMFENFAAMVGNSDRFEASVAASEKIQEWLDAAWTGALKNERS